MTPTLAMQAACLTWMLAGLVAAAPAPVGAPLWMRPPIPVSGEHVGTTERVSTVRDLDAIPASTVPLVTLKGQLAEDAAALDSIEAKLHDGLAWLEASAVLWLGGDQLTEHALISLTDQGFDSGQCPALIGALIGQPSTVEGP